MSGNRSQPGTKALARWPALFALAGVVGSVFAHLAGGLGVAPSLRLGAVTTGTAALIVAVRALRALGEGRHEGSFGGAPVPSFTSTVVAALRRRRVRRAPAVGPAALELLIALGERSAADFHARLQPRLRAVAVGRLVRAGIDPNDGAAVSDALGPLGMAVVRESGPRPEHDAPGVDASTVRDLLRRVEGLA